MRYKINWIFLPDASTVISDEPDISIQERERIITQVEQVMWDTGKFNPESLSGNIVVLRKGTGFGLVFKSIKPDELSEQYFNDLFDGFMLH